jgi:predicted methyltransferase MtxX (methanogen marker protein 4)
LRQQPTGDLDMDQRTHRIVGIYATRANALSASAQVQNLGIAPDQISLLEGASTPIGTDSADESDKVLNDLLRDGAIGTVVGSAAGAGVTLALAAANLTLFIASPILSALYLLGWGASLGGLVGAVVGAEGGKGDLPTLIKDALEAGHVVMVVHASTDDEADRARHIVGGFDDSGADRTPVPARQAFVTAAS